MTELDEPAVTYEEAGFGAEVDGDREDVADQDRPQRREPTSAEQAARGSCANPVDQVS
jgi:hypothetical protein